MEYTNFEALKEEEKGLILAAEEAMENAYNLVDNHIFGAAVLLESGGIVQGANFYLSSTGAHLCAERAAVVTANSLGHRDIKILAVMGKEKDDGGKIFPPCGICRQFLIDFSEMMGKDINLLISSGDKKKVVRTSVRELLPLAFVGAAA
ncbi:MAG: cytidine deaminase [Patescibacteria group bacterium]|nr:cytidine deaminase [Patescibacteria group bacterium]